MKRLFSTTILFLAFVAATYAQQSFKLYRLTSVEYAETFLKHVGEEIKLNGQQVEQLRELFTKTQAHQDELFLKPENTEGDRYEAYMNRQQGHLEGNLRMIIGEENYKLYEEAKPKIEVKMKAFVPSKKN